MINILIINNINNDYFGIPAYIWTGLLGILAAVISAVLLALLTSHYVNKKKEITRMEGEIMEQRILIYKNLYNKLMGFINLKQYPPLYCDNLREVLKESDLLMTEETAQNYFPDFFENPNAMVNNILEFEKYCIENKIYFEDNVSLSVLLFQNYCAIFTRLDVLYKEGCTGYPNLNKQAQDGERFLFNAIGLLLCNEFGIQCNAVCDEITKYMKNMSFKPRKKMDYSIENHGASDVYITNKLKDTIIMSKRKNFQKLITSILVSTIFGDMES
jgi:hypothetical protein